MPRYVLYARYRDDRYSWQSRYCAFGARYPHALFMKSSLYHIV